MEVVARPVLEQIARDLPPDFRLDSPGLPLRWRIVAVGPVINVITGVIVAGVAAHGHHEGLRGLGLSWVVAVAVSFTVSLELVVLVVRSMASSLADIRAATERVRVGDYSARVPVVASDEMGSLAQSFNTMVEGLDERERLREAFGAYVDPGLADRVLQEGSDLAGEEVQVTVLFLDIRDFTAFAEHAEPREVVALLNQFWELVVPVLLRHGGHANKFIGDGLLGVFGAPQRLPDHAERAVAAAQEIVALVRERYEGRVGVGIGVNSGPVVAGTVGGGGRVEFTVIGDAVNTASRVEAATRETGDAVLVTDATRALLTDGRFVLEDRPPMPLKGKRTDVGLGALVEKAGAGAGAEGTGAGAEGTATPEQAGAGAGADGTPAPGAGAGAPAAVTLPETVSVGRDQTGQD
jgi:adenylate cyclase